MARTKTAVELVASVANTSGSITRGRVDLTDCDGGFLTFRMTNGATGPSTNCSATILVAHAATLPAAAAAGTGATDWKSIASYALGITANESVSIGIPIAPGVMHLEIEFKGNTGQLVTVEAYMSKLAYS